MKFFYYSILSKYFMKCMYKLKSLFLKLTSNLTYFNNADLTLIGNTNITVFINCKVQFIMNNLIRMGKA